LNDDVVQFSEVGTVNETGVHVVGADGDAVKEPTVRVGAVIFTDQV
jgi:hypothetical protein